MEKMMNQLDILAKNAMGVGTRNVNVVDVGGVNLEEAKFEVLYNDEVKSYPTKKKFFMQTTQGRVVIEVRIQMRDGEILIESDLIGTSLGKKEKRRKIGMFTIKRQNPKHFEGGQTEDMLSRILNKV